MKKNDFTIDELLNFFQNSFLGTKKEKGDSVCAAKKVNGLSGEGLMEKIKELINLPASNNYIDPVGELIDYAKKFIYGPNCTLSVDSKYQYVCNFKRFVQVVMGFFYANTYMTMGKHDYFFCQLIAENALFVDPEVVKDVRLGKLGTDYNKACAKKAGTSLDKTKYNNPFASWDYMEHFRDNKLKKNKIKYKFDPKYLFYKRMYPGIKPMMAVDDNTYANQYIKKAIIESFERKYNTHFSGVSYTWFKNYEACHVWDFPDDRRYYASIANLVLVPRALAQLTDHNNAVKELLRYEVNRRFSFYPQGVTPPNKPKYYPKVWRQL